MAFYSQPLLLIYNLTMCLSCLYKITIILSMNA